MADENAAQPNNEAAEEGVKPSDLYEEEGKEKEKPKPEGDAEEPEKEEGKEADDKGEEDTDKKPEEGEDDVVPEKYDIKVAEDSLLGDEDVERIAAQAKELGLTNEEAQELADMESDAVGRYQEKLDKKVEDIRAGWLKAAEKDKEIGGDAFKENVENSKRVIDKFGTDEFKKALEETGFGNHPEVIRLFSRIGKLMADDKMVFSREQSSGEKPIEEVFYGGN